MILRLSGDFELKKNPLKKNKKDFIYIGCQILNKNLLKKKTQNINFPINEIWDKLLKKKI